MCNQNIQHSHAASVCYLMEFVICETSYFKENVLKFIFKKREQILGGDLISCQRNDSQIN